MRLSWGIERTPSLPVEEVPLVSEFQTPKRARVLSIKRELEIIVRGRTPVKWHLDEAHYLGLSVLRDLHARKLVKVRSGQKLARDSDRILSDHFYTQDSCVAPRRTTSGVFLR